MTRFLLSRAAGAFVVLMAKSFVIFALIGLMPGDPVDLLMNANPDAMALLGLLRVCGVEPSPDGDGLLIAPQSPPERYILDLPLIRLDVSSGRLTGEYRSAGVGNTVLHIRIPAGARVITAQFNGQPVEAGQMAEVKFPLRYGANEKIAFELTWK